MFPNLHCEFTNMVAEVKEEQLCAVTAVRSECVVLETYAPYFKPRGSECSTPQCLMPAAEAVAQALERPALDILEECRVNAEKMFRLW